MDSRTTDSLGSLLILSLEGAITDEQVNQLNLLLRDSAENMQYCIDFVSIAACLHKSRGLLDDSGRSFIPHHLDEIFAGPVERDEQVHAEEAARLDDTQKKAIRKAAEEALERFMIEERRRQEELAYKLYIARRRRRALGIGSLAALLTIVFCYWLLRPRPQPPSTVMAAPVVAALTHAYEARWDLTHIAPIVGTELTAGPIKLIEGLVEIRFKTGTRVILEAPAEMNLVDEVTAYLTSGALTAYVPEPATGFVVETPSVRVTDLGTQFGLLAYGGGATDVHLLSGSVRALFRGADGDELPHLRYLYRNDAMSFDAAAGKVSPLDLDRERFALSWDDVLYKPRVSGAIKFQRSVPSSLREDAVQSDRSIHLFLEATDVSLTRDVTVDITEPGHYQGHQGLPVAIQAGLKVDSYLIHWDPASRDKLAQIASGSITFRRPIVGLIISEGWLSATNSLFGAAGTEYHSAGRGLETEGDTVTLSQDRLTLQLGLRAPTAVDEIRILVAAPTAEQQ
ncbi:MAG TPA: FecR domain-containing protein [Sedimentisphaerales bacterium]|nr:FecR domain-containing protein [Sedimentisphaerales bacterium]